MMAAVGATANDGDLLRYERMPLAVRLGVLAVFVLPWALGGREEAWPVLIGVAALVVRPVLVIHPLQRWIEYRVGILVPFFGFSRRTLTQVSLEERVVRTSKNGRRRDYHVMVAREGAMPISLASGRRLSTIRQAAEQLAKSLRLPLLERATGAGLRPFETLDQSVGSKIRRAGWQALPLGSPGRLVITRLPNAAGVELPPLSRLRGLAWPLAFPSAFTIGFGAFAGVGALRVTAVGGDWSVAIVFGGAAAVNALVLVVVAVIYRDRFTRVQRIEVGASGLVIHATAWGRARERTFALDEIESIGVGGRALLSGFSRDVARCVVIASDRDIASIGHGLTFDELGWLAAYLNQAVAAASSH